MLKDGYIWCEICDKQIRIATIKEIHEHEEDPSLELEKQPDICNDCLAQG